MTETQRISQQIADNTAKITELTVANVRLEAVQEYLSKDNSKKLTTAQRVESALQENGRPMEVAEIAKAIGHKNVNSLKVRMYSKGFRHFKRPSPGLFAIQLAGREDIPASLGLSIQDTILNKCFKRLNKMLLGNALAKYHRTLPIAEEIGRDLEVKVEETLRGLVQIH